MNIELRERLDKALLQLHPRNAQIIRRQFGLSGICTTQAAIANELGISRQAIGQATKSSLQRLRRILIDADQQEEYESLAAVRRREAMRQIWLRQIQEVKDRESAEQVLRENIARANREAAERALCEIAENFERKRAERTKREIEARLRKKRKREQKQEQKLRERIWKREKKLREQREYGTNKRLKTVRLGQNCLTMRTANDPQDHPA